MFLLIYLVLYQRHIRCLKSCVSCFHIWISIKYTQWLQGKWFKKEKPSSYACVCVFSPHFSLPAKNLISLVTHSSSPVATVTGHCVLPSKRWPCPACQAGLCRAPRWTCPCWVSWTCWRRWSGSPGCGPTSFPLAQSSLEPKQHQKHMEREPMQVCWREAEYSCGFWVGSGLEPVNTLEQDVSTHSCSLVSSKSLCKSLKGHSSATANILNCKLALLTVTFYIQSYIGCFYPKWLPGENKKHVSAVWPKFLRRNQVSKILVLVATGLLHHQSNFIHIRKTQNKVLNNGNNTARTCIMLGVFSKDDSCTRQPGKVTLKALIFLKQNKNCRFAGCLLRQTCPFQFYLKYIRAFSTALVGPPVSSHPSSSMRKVQCLLQTCG